jgi:hypothetical protein
MPTAQAKRQLQHQARWLRLIPLAILVYIIS